MANPVTIALVADTWTKVATAVTKARIYYGAASSGTSPTSFRMTYVLTGGAAPGADVGVGLPRGDRDHAENSYRAEHGEAVDIYLKAVGGTGTCTVHNPIGSSAIYSQPAAVVNDVAIVAAPGGGFNVPTDDGILMDGSSDISFQLYLLGGQSNAHADRTVTVIFQVSDDVMVGATRQWVTTAAGYDHGTDATQSSWSSVGLTAAGACVDFEHLMHKRIRANYTFSAAPGTDHPGAVVINEMRKG